LVADDEVRPKAVVWLGFYASDYLQALGRSPGDRLTRSPVIAGRDKRSTVVAVLVDESKPQHIDRTISQWVWFPAPKR
jgi:hypothetical protein